MTSITGGVPQKGPERLPADAHKPLEVASVPRDTAARIFGQQPPPAREGGSLDQLLQRKVQELKVEGEDLTAAVVAARLVGDTGNRSASLTNLFGRVVDEARSCGDSLKRQSLLDKAANFVAYIPDQQARSQCKKELVQEYAKTGEFEKSYRVIRNMVEGEPKVEAQKFLAEQKDLHNDFAKISIRVAKHADNKEFSQALEAIKEFKEETPAKWMAQAYVAVQLAKIPASPEDAGKLAKSISDRSARARAMSGVAYTFARGGRLSEAENVVRAMEVEPQHEKARTMQFLVEKFLEKGNLASAKAIQKEMPEDLVDNRDVPNFKELAGKTIEREDKRAHQDRMGRRMGGKG
jgi:hypothetical protein